MPAPTKHPDWATDGTNTVEPPAGKVAAGWVPAEQPPAGWFNWWQNLVGLWTRWLEERIDTLEGEHGDLSDDAALKSAQNVFTQSQVINTPGNDPGEPLIFTSQKISDYVLPPESDYPGGPNRWRLVMSVPTQGGAWAGMYVGQSPDGAALVNNARWDVLTQRWVQYDPAYPSTAMVGRSGQYTVSFVPSGASVGGVIPPWEFWPNDGGGDLVVGGNIQANGIGGGSGAVIARNRFMFATPKPHVTRKGVWGGFGQGVIADVAWIPPGTYDTPCISLVGAGHSHMWPLNLPHGALLAKIEISVHKAGIGTIGQSGPGTAALFGRVVGIGSPPPYAAADLPIAYNVATSASGNVTLTINIDPVNQELDIAALEYFIRVKGADAGDKVYGFLLTWSEPGLDCYGG